MSDGLFIAGTDTGSGKTVVAAALLLAARNAGLDAVPMKPVQTGCTGRPLRAPDLEFCLRMARLNPAGRERDMMCPARYRPACSPHLAAERSGRPIRVPRLLRAWRQLRARHARVLAEGAGGLFVPLNRRMTMIGLAARFGAPILLVARNRLGALNHTLLSLEALRNRGLPTAGYVLVDDPAAPRAIRDSNARTLQRLAPERYLGRLPPLACLAAADPDPARFARATRHFGRAVWDGMEGDPGRGAQRSRRRPNFAAI